MSNTIEIDLGKHTVPSDTVRYIITVTCEGIHQEIERRSPEGLKRDGISMRNIAGQWIKEEATK